MLLATALASFTSLEAEAGSDDSDGADSASRSASSACVASSACLAVAARSLTNALRARLPRTLSLPALAFAFASSKRDSSARAASIGRGRRELRLDALGVVIALSVAGVATDEDEDAEEEDEISALDETAEALDADFATAFDSELGWLLALDLLAFALPLLLLPLLLFRDGEGVDDEAEAEPAAAVEGSGFAGFAAAITSSTTLNTIESSSLMMKSVRSLL